MSGKGKYSSLVVKTDHQNVFDSRWSELKIDGKNIPNRSNHIAALFNNKMYVHGGYDAERGVLADFYAIDISDDAEVFAWSRINNNIQGAPLKLKSHCGIAYKAGLYVFGGETHTN